ncbi:agamous-like MADS-box protein AGL11 [Punica granatum]|uniref:Agamous-like MADS-box protein AGL11 n=1 Tax=Punica granatum TaxID=22663 RepID=A0A6P8D6J9_PUNGR|nr:agamous-like MADS-box protein AGL11 [Punica granatum]
MQESATASSTPVTLSCESIKTTIERYKKASSDSWNTTSVTEINAQYYQQESAKLRQQIQMLHLMGDSLSALSVKELKQLENRLERGITRIRSKKHEMLLAEIEYSQKKEIEMENETVYLCTKIAEIERMEHVNMVMGQEMNAIQVLASCNFFPPNMLEGGNSYSHPDKKLHLGYESIILCILV